MATRFFRKMGLEPVPLPDGRSVPFKSLDGVQGFLATSDPSLWTAFEACMREGRSGLTEISWAEFDSQYVQKKSSGQTLNPLWREELTRGSLMPSQSQLTERLNALQAVVGVASPPPVAHPTPAPVATMSVQAQANAEIAAALPQAVDYKPEVGKRRKAKVA